MTTSKIQGSRSKARIAERRQNALDGLKLQLRKETEDGKKKYVSTEISRLEKKLNLLPV